MCGFVLKRFKIYFYLPLNDSQTVFKLLLFRSIKARLHEQLISTHYSISKYFTAHLPDAITAMIIRQITTIITRQHFQRTHEYPDYCTAYFV